MRTIVWLTSGYAAVSALTMATVVVTGTAGDAVWIRGTIVAVASLYTLSLAVRAARGQDRLLRRLRVLTTIMLAAIVVVVALPGTFPLWFKLEQCLCGLLLLPVVVRLSRRARGGAAAPATATLSRRE